MDVARFNFSHGDHEEQKIRMNLLKKVRKELKLPIAILLDTKGPEIRTGILEGRTESISGRRKPVYTDNGTDRGK